MRKKTCSPITAKVIARTGWNIIRPSWVIGATANAQINALHPFGVYAAVQAHLKKPLAFPGDFAAWQSLPYYSSAMMTGFFSEWVVLEDSCRNEPFNSVDASPLPWNRFWPELGRWFGIQEIGRPAEDEQGMVSIAGRDGKDTPLGFVAIFQMFMEQFVLTDGWTGYVDTIESIWFMFDEMSQLHMLPPMLAGSPRPCI